MSTCIQFRQSPKLKRSLSHANIAEIQSKKYFPLCQEGDTILSNFFIYTGDKIIATYYKKENDEMVLYSYDGPLKKFKQEKWTYQSCDFLLQ